MISLWNTFAFEFAVAKPLRFESAISILLVFWWKSGKFDKQFWFSVVGFRGGRCLLSWLAGFLITNQIKRDFWKRGLVCTLRFASFSHTNPHFQKPLIWGVRTSKQKSSNGKGEVGSKWSGGSGLGWVLAQGSRSVASFIMAVSESVASLRTERAGLEAVSGFNWVHNRRKLGHRSIWVVVRKGRRIVWWWY